MDTAVQVSNLITAASQIFAVLASLGPVGVGIAIATIATMTAAFAATKIKAFQMVNDQQQSFGEGGWIDGDSHEKGGVKYRRVDGKPGSVELEGGEHVTNKRSAAKYADILDAINDDDETAFREMLQEMGIGLSDPDEPRETVRLIRETTMLKNSADLAEGSGGPDPGIEALTREVQAIRAFMRKPSEDDNYYFEYPNDQTVIKKPKRNGAKK